MHRLRWHKFILLALLVSRSVTAIACENRKVFSIEAQPADQALLQFARQAGLSALFPGNAFNAATTNRVAGTYCIEEALDVLLRGVNIEASVDATGQLVIGSIVEDQTLVDGGGLAQAGQQAGGAKAGPERNARSIIKHALLSFFTGSGEKARKHNSEIVLPEEITITGSRIRQMTGMTAPTLVTSLSVAELAMANPGNTIAEQLDALPQFFSTQSAQRGGTTFIDAGGSYLNLRGMGQNRTLVLLNGSRVIPSDAFGSVNVDNFPTALLSRVEIVTGGASAAYGADAISGVVNFVLDREYEGLKAAVSSGVTERGDGENWSVSLAGGHKIGERLHLLASVEARYIDQIEPDPQRLDNWNNWGHVRNPDWVSALATPNEPQRITMPYVYPTNYSPQGLITTPGFKYSNYTFTDDGAGVRPYVFGQYASVSGAGATRTQSGGPEYSTWVEAHNGGPDSNEVVQRSGFLNLDYALTERTDVYAQMLLARTESNAYGRRGQPALDSIWSATVYANNPFLPLEVRDEMRATGTESISVSKRGTVYGPNRSNYYADRDDRNIHQLSSFSAGFRSKLQGSWSLSGSGQYGESKVSSSALNILRLDNFFMALDTVPHPVTGMPVCNISVTNPSAEQLKAAVAGKILASPLSLVGLEVDSPLGPMNFADCKPINVFGLGNVSPAARDWVEDEEKKNLRTLEQDFVELLATGELHEGWGAGPVTLAGGYSYRAEEFSQLNFPLFGERGLSNAPQLGIRGIPGGFTGFGNRSLHQFSAIGVGSGDFSVSEWFGEINIPILDLSSGQALGGNLAYRRSDYSRHGPIVSWKAGMDFQLSSDWRWRVTRSRDVREPNFSEQFVAGVGGATLNDPVFNESYVITSIGGPNPNLQTELADTITTGLVWQPTFANWIEGWQLAVDWYDIELSSAVARLGSQRLADDCFQSGNADICALVQRNPATNRVDRVIDRYFNVGGARTSGVDFELHYETELDFIDSVHEALELRGFIGYLEENSTTTASGIKVDALGSRERPQYTANIMLKYTMGAWAVRLQQRYYDETLVNSAWVEGIDVDDNSIASQSITNVAFSYGRKLGIGSNWGMNFSITNLLDREPPVIPGQLIGNSFDQYGRRYQLSLNMNFL